MHTNNLPVSWLDDHQGRAGQQCRQCRAIIKAKLGNSGGSAGQRKRQCRASSSAGATAHKIMPPVGVTSFLYIQVLYGELIFGFLLFCSSPSINKGLNPFYGGNSFNAIFSSLLILLHHLDIQKLTALHKEVIPITLSACSSSLQEA